MHGFGPECCLEARKKAPGDSLPLMVVSQELWGPETSKAVENFPVSGERVPVGFVLVVVETAAGPEAVGAPAPPAEPLVASVAPTADNGSAPSTPTSFWSYSLI